MCLGRSHSFVRNRRLREVKREIQSHHLSRPAYVYLRQSTPGQVLRNDQSTERQYALRDKALKLGWEEHRIRVLDGDLGLSGAQAENRGDFRTMVADVSLGKVGAIFALEASRLARSCADWHRLIEICAFTQTLVVDEDGIYDPADFNDELLLGLKGTIARAEAHLIRARLHGAKLNKARKGELRFSLPVGLCYEEGGKVVLDPDGEVQGAVHLLFETFRETGSAYGVVRSFSQRGLKFPKRAYGGVWAGKLIWAHLTHGRVLSILKNPAYAPSYVYGRRKCVKSITEKGSVKSRTVTVEPDLWKVTIPQHHPGYITWEEFLKNQQKLQENRTNDVARVLSGPAREGLALLQGLCICGHCGRKLTLRYRGNGGIYPVYQCNWKRRDGLESKSCLSVRCDLVDEAISKRILEAIKPFELKLATKAVSELEKRREAVYAQWQKRIQRAEYEAQLAQRRYEEVDPSNRLVAATLETRWNAALEKLRELKEEFSQFQGKEIPLVTAKDKEKVLALARDFPKLWNSPTTSAKDRKRIIRLLIKDITVVREGGKLLLGIRWQGGCIETLTVNLPPKIQDRLRYPQSFVEEVRSLAQKNSDAQIAQILNSRGKLSAKGKVFTAEMIKGIRYRYRIPAHRFQQPGEITVAQVAEKFGVNRTVVYYWLERGFLTGRRKNKGSPYWIKLTAKKEKELREWVRNSRRITPKFQEDR